MRIYDQPSGLQRVTVNRTDRGLTLLLDGMPQFVEANEYRYHESLAVVPCLFGQPKRAFIGGGGDGLAAARLLRMGVERVVLCDYDPAVTRLAREIPAWRRLNDGVFDDPRVEVVHADAVRWLTESDEIFDLVILDFPDPYFAPLGRLYTVDYYRAVHAHLSPEGLMVVQTLAEPSTTRIIRATVRAAFAHEAHYRPTTGAAFTLGSKAPLARRRAVPGWCRFLTEAFVDTLFVRPRDTEALVNPGRTPPNAGDGLALVEQALVAGLLPQISEPHRYRPDTVEIYLDARDLPEATPAQIALMLRAIGRRKDVVLVISTPLAGQHGDDLAAIGFRPAAGGKTYEHYRLRLSPSRLAAQRAQWARLDDGSVAEVESVFGRPADHPDIATHLEAYFAEFGDRFHDAPDGTLSLAAHGWFVVTRGPEGQLRSLAKLIEKPDDDLIEIELFYGVGNRRQNALSLLLLIGYCATTGARHMETFVPPGVFGRGLERLGARRVQTMRVYFKTREEGAR